MEPDLSRDTVAALLLTETGVVDYQALVDTLTREIEESDYLFKREDVAVGVRKGRREQRGHGVVMLGTRVVRVDRDTKGKGWVVQLENGWEGKGEGERGELESVRAEVVVNAAGLGATSLLEGVVPDSDRVQMRPSKGGRQNSLSSE
jgi:2-hydroxyglutarate dehydrogenase